jgi:hypothetical protein
MRFHKVTRRVAQRHNLRTLEGDALYDLMALSFDIEDPACGMRYAREAITAYGAGHTRIQRMAKDVAWLWMDRFGEFENAAHVFTALLDHIWEPNERLLLLASLARAAAGAGWKEVFESMWIESWVTLRHQPTEHGHAAALTQLALGASTFGSWDRAQLAADEALRIARKRAEGEVVLLTESILGAIQEGVIAEERIHDLVGTRNAAIERNGAATELASDFAEAMRVRRDNAPHGPSRTTAKTA